jgi:hypothetical protein
MVRIFCDICPFRPFSTLPSSEARRTFKWQFRMACRLRPEPSRGAVLVLVHRELTERIIGCFFEVYNELGQGFPERVLRRAMMIAMLEKGLRAEEEVQLKVHFRGEVIGTFFVDIVVEGAVLIEIKALPELERRSVTQLLNYLKAAGGGVGLLLNFGQRPELSRRIVGDIAKIGG